MECPESLRGFENGSTKVQTLVLHAHPSSSSGIYLRSSAFICGLISFARQHLSQMDRFQLLALLIDQALHMHEATGVV